VRGRTEGGQLIGAFSEGGSFRIAEGNARSTGSEGVFRIAEGCSEPDLEITSKGNFRVAESVCARICSRRYGRKQIS